ncbi:beta-galactosidase [Salinimonas sediminis]|uniref:Beta-galactosidase n=1 Tax=Salinimonas sediminis TaxID=2303538 RepID=A0A346NN89_9ALTE|nr:beta-galactosidase [Salinimonas sediminis]AXR06996.1 beta-galactosidase [Salinimonas sediminis]
MLGICYYPEHWAESQWAQDAKEMRELRLTYVRIAEFAWSRLEPTAGNYTFEWLDRAIDTLAAEGLKVIMCTPTATPPRWLVEQYPDMLAVDVNTGLVRGFGSRRHYDFSSEDYRREAMRISAVLAERYGTHPAIVGWQTDNELACHDTTPSASDSALAAFQRWCEARYGSIETLNEAWGNVFWSMEYPSFDSIDVPYFAVTEANPSHSLAFRRFSSDQVIKFHDEMVDIIRQHAPGRFVTHNFIPMSDTQTDNYALARNLDFASFDNYPLGRTDLFFAGADTAQFKRYMRTGHPDFSSYYFDQTRGLCQQNFWIMEQQPGPVNWAVHNPRPEPGMIALWSWVAFAHGADTVCYFRWRQAAFAQEQMHAGLKRVDNSPSAAYPEVQQVKAELDKLNIELNDPLHYRVAMVSTTTNQWVSEIEQQGQSYHHEKVEFEYYHALRLLGLNVAFVSPDHSLQDFDLVVVPTMPIISDTFIANCKATNATVVFGPRSGAKTEEFQYPRNLGPGKLQSLMPIKVLSVETLREDISETLHFEGETFHSNRWREELGVEENTEVMAQYENGKPAVVRHNNLVYVATLGCVDFTKSLLGKLAAEQGITTFILPEDVRTAERGDYRFLFNYAGEPVRIDGFEDKEFIVGSNELSAYGYAITKR